MSVPTNEIYALVESRKEYDEAWLKTARVMKLLEVENSTIWQSPYSFAWLMALNKLVRAMATPKHLDHWKDIQGYCQLIIDEISKEAPNETGSDSATGVS